ncbi:polysaccharide pyruvyl transferase family protein [Amantichitinum ursilacus]|uniref:Colanic acid biosynthesis protein n=1 Tax=Amantichitinum ursilacus TaxID=857265 RepID=A0A0N0XHH4_9NEIS|nr:polysaccharide pyruvyl transferase family protein [Amantichitinum ursilacus]KPC51825.1 colanic acid biosynthesis protein [Amantichitinum ursilacus]
MKNTTSAGLRQPATLTVGLLWHSISSDNLGVGALTESQIAICEKAAQRAGVSVNYILFGTSGGSSYAPAGVRIEQGPRVSIKRMLTGNSDYLREVERCDLVLDIGEGDSFADIYGTKRYLFLLASKLGVLAKNKPLVLSPQTIGPFDKPLQRWAASAVMRKAECVFARDEMSSAYLEKLGVRGNVREVIDVAFRLPFTKPVREAGGKTKIGINVSGLLFAGGYTGNNQFGLTIDYAEYMRSLLRTWTALPDTEVHLIAHVIPDNMPEEDDRVAITQLLKEFPSAFKAPEFRSPAEAKSFISGMDFMTGARMHACIAAFSSGVPVVPLAYSRKFNGLMATLGYTWLADGKAMTTAEAVAITLKGFEQREELAAQVARGNARAAARLDDYEDFLVDLFNQVQPAARRSAVAAQSLQQA